MKKTFSILTLLLVFVCPSFAQMEYIEETNIQNFINYNDFYQPPYVKKDHYNLSEKCTTEHYQLAKVYIQDFIFNIPLKYRFCDKDFEFEVDGKIFLLQPEQTDSVLFDGFVYYPAANYEKTFRKTGFLPTLYRSKKKTIYSASICSVREVEAHPIAGNDNFQFDQTKKVLIYNAKGNLEKSFTKKKKALLEAFTSRESSKMKRIMKKEKLSVKKDEDLRILFKKAMSNPIKM